MSGAKVAVLVVSLGVGGWLLRPASLAPPEEFAANDNKVLLLAIDGMDWETVDTLQAQLPTLRGLRAQGMVLPSQQIPNFFLGADPHPAKTHTSGITGAPATAVQSPAPHGVVELGIKVTGKYQQVPVTSLQRRRLAIWEILSAFDVKTAVSNWPGSWPAEHQNGALVSDRFFLDRLDLGAFGSNGNPHYVALPATYKSGARHLTFPDDLADSLADTLSRQRAQLDAPFLTVLRQLRGAMPAVADDLDRLIAAVETDALATCAVLEMLEREPSTQFVALPMTAIQVSGTLFWKYFEPQPWWGNPRLKAELDESLMDRLRGVVPGAIASVDHQIGRLLAAMQGADGQPNRTCTMIYSGHGIEANPSLTDRNYSANRLLQRMGLQARHEDGSLDPTRTRVFDSGIESDSPFRRMSLNFQGRYPQGIVPQGPLSAAWNDVVAKVRGLRVRPTYKIPGSDKPGDNLMITELADSIEGDMLFGVCTEMQPASEILIDGEWVPVDELFPEDKTSGRNSLNGFFMVSLPGVDGEGLGKRLPPFGQETANSRHVAPTVLALLGLPQPDVERHTFQVPMLWFMPLGDAQLASVHKTVELEQHLARRTGETPLAERFKLLREELVQLGYVRPRPAPNAEPKKTPAE